MLSETSERFDYNNIQKQKSK